jgi:hypothetical protein
MIHLAPFYHRQVYKKTAISNDMDSNYLRFAVLHGIDTTTKTNSTENIPCG